MQHTEFIDAICAKVDNGARFMVNLEKRTLRLDGRLVNLDEVDVFRVDEAVMFRCIEDLYWQYRDMLSRHVFSLTLCVKYVLTGLEKHNVIANITTFAIT